MTFEDLANRNDAIFAMHADGKTAAEIVAALGIEGTKRADGTERMSAEAIVRTIVGDDDGMGGI